MSTTPTMPMPPQPPAARSSISPWPPRPPQRPVGLSDDRGATGATGAKRSRWQRKTTLAGVVTALGIVVSLIIDLEPLSVLGILFFLVVPVEKLYPRHRGQKIRRPEVGTDMAWALLIPIMTPIGGAVAATVAVISLAWLPGLLIRPLVVMIPGSIAPFVGITLFDLAIYWLHRWSHEVPLLWRFHAVHHSTEKLDWVSGFRNHPVDGALVAPPFVFLIAAGFSPEFSGILVVIQVVTGLFLHANTRLLLRPLHRIVMTPEFHHWHHANEADAFNHNYSVFLPLWDLMFGTYFMPKGRRPQVYGIHEEMPQGVIAQFRHPFRGMGNPLVLVWRGIRHPFRSIRDLARLVRPILAQIWRSTRRPTRSSKPKVVGTAQ